MKKSSNTPRDDDAARPDADLDWNNSFAEYDEEAESIISAFKNREGEAG